ncbi:tannase/feruloyl esterase family alpha/beta hydrolase [Novosphingobium sp. PhB165]|uniref:tannase/feruloyl esterase family alpha/beta hydrolase n=1 Tax=Novosphingobium sp. PhB165 TaxID=2485105 RepID=UPI001404BA21|nr:tannase/feruloyl esterase family alpha/beta hydrolase [Novosphingobium sp. PhB165]
MLALPAAAEARTPADPAAGPAGRSTCAQLAHLAFPDAADVRAEEVAAGSFSAPGGGGRLSSIPAMLPSGTAKPIANPAFCRVTASLRPSGDSDIRVEVWLPAQGWNGKFLAVGSFGWGGMIMYGGLLDGLAQGYAVANNDTGHQATLGAAGAGGEFALSHPEKLIDYAWRANHSMVVYAKALVRARYGKGPTKSYWIGCSLGGLQGLIEAQRFPADFDGIVAGAPPNPISSFNASQIWASWLIQSDPARAMPKAKLALLHDAVVKECGGVVGAQQGFVEEPGKCTFDPGELQCKGDDAPDCLTAAQVFLMRQLYEGPRNSRTGANIYPGPARGSELTLDMFTQAKPMPVAFDMFRVVAFENPQFTLAEMDFGAKFEAAAAKIDPLLGVGSNLAPFFKRGGRLLFYVGWNDFHNPTELGSYYQRLAQDSGRLAGPGTRLFAVPGMNHCMGGEGCDTFDKLGAIDAWATTGRAPEEMVSAKYDPKGEAIRTRPICAWPKVARYRGTGNIAAAASFACVAP